MHLLDGMRNTKHAERSEFYSKDMNSNSINFWSILSWQYVQGFVIGPTVMKRVSREIRDSPSEQQYFGSVIDWQWELLFLRASQLRLHFLHPLKSFLQTRYEKSQTIHRRLRSKVSGMLLLERKPLHPIGRLFQKGENCGEKQLSQILEFCISEFIYLSKSGLQSRLFETYKLGLLNEYWLTRLTHDRESSKQLATNTFIQGMQTWIRWLDELELLFEFLESEKQIRPLGHLFLSPRLQDLAKLHFTLLALLFRKCDNQSSPDSPQMTKAWNEITLRLSWRSAVR